ncbi:MAG: RodZ domain-containing protein [Jannaschia sp.]
MFGRKSRLLSKAESPSRGYDSFDMRLGDEMRGERATLGKSLMDVQRELRIKASYIAAIENADLTAFDSQSFVAGYVRSYARYLNLDPEIVFARFCEESGFGGISALKPMESEISRRAIALGPLPGLGGLATKATRKKASGPVDPLMGAGNPFANKATPVFAGFEPGALGSLAVLALLVGGIGYGGWTLVKEIQRVQVAPVEQAPELLAELDPLAPVPAQVDAPEVAGVDLPTADALSRLYRPQALEAPILTARDAPIATITPGTGGALASADPRSGLAGPDARSIGIGNGVTAALAEALGTTAAAEETPGTPQVLASAPDAVVLFAVRPAWVRIRSADGETLFEKILEPGETYEVPASEVAPTLRTGNSGALYLAVAGQTYGPVAPGAQVVSGIALAADAVTTAYAVADLEGDRDLARVVAELATPASGLPGASD